jgi:hypothetical protein
MKLRTIALATTFALSSTFAFAQQNEATGTQGCSTGAPGVKPTRHLHKPRKAARLVFLG